MWVTIRAVATGYTLRFIRGSRGLVTQQITEPQLQEPVQRREGIIPSGLQHQCRQSGPCSGSR